MLIEIQGHGKEDKKDKGKILLSAEILNKGLHKDKLCDIPQRAYLVLCDSHSTMKHLMDDNEDKTVNLAEEKKKKTVQATDVKNAITACLPDIVKTAIEETTATKKWSDLFQNEITKKVGDSFENTVSTQFMKNQAEIVKKTSAKHDQDFYERERRSRNIVISNVAECDSEVVGNRIQHDKDIAIDICDISDQDIVKCFRIGKTEGRTRPRLLVLTLKSPDFAKKLHNYGLGKKVMIEGHEVWINADLTLAERTANFEARQRRRQKLHKPANSPFSANVEESAD